MNVSLCWYLCYIKRRFDTLNYLKALTVMWYFQTAYPQLLHCCTFAFVSTLATLKELSQKQIRGVLIFSNAKLASFTRTAFYKIPELWMLYLTRANYNVGMNISECRWLYCNKKRSLCPKLMYTQAFSSFIFPLIMKIHWF
jgi:hypothetical protein